MPLRLPRRHLLAAAACTPLAAAAAAPRERATQPEPVAPASDDGAQRSATYRETEHARRYYRSAAKL